MVTAAKAAKDAKTVRAKSGLNVEYSEFECSKTSFCDNVFAASVETGLVSGWLSMLLWAMT